MLARVFVYGTLKPGEERWPILAPFAIGAGATREASARGRMFDTGYGWPAAVFDSAINDQVPGVVVALQPDSVGAALVTLDEVEGVSEGEYERIVVQADGISCWAYHWPAPTGQFRRINSWPPRP